MGAVPKPIHNGLRLPTETWTGLDMFFPNSDPSPPVIGEAFP